MIENLGIEAGIGQEATPMREKLACSAMARLVGLATDLLEITAKLRETFETVIVSEIVSEPPSTELKGELKRPMHSGSEHGRNLMDIADRLEESLTRITAIIGSVDI